MLSSIMDSSSLPVCALLAFTIFVSYMQLVWLPKPLSLDEAGVDGFSETEALSHLNTLTSFGPRPVGSTSLEDALKYVYHTAKRIETGADGGVRMEVEFFSANPGSGSLGDGLFRGKTLAYAKLEHVLVRLSSKALPHAPNASILVSAHVDTVFSGEGAGDDGSSISVMLEMVRALSHAAQTFRNSVIFLFNTGEEEGLLGSHSFVSQHPWFPSVKTVIDLEAQGAGGKSNLFQAPEDWLIRMFAKVAKYPSIQMPVQDVFLAGSTSSTDFQLYKEVANLSGIDFAYMENGAVYHTRNDAVRLVRPGSLQHSGENVLALIKAAGLSSELPDVEKVGFDNPPKVVCFDILGHYAVIYSREFGTMLYALTLIAVGKVFTPSSMKDMTALALGTLGVLLTWILSLGSALAVAVTVSYTAASSIGYVACPLLGVVLFGSAALFGATSGHTAGYILLRFFLAENDTEVKFSQEPPLEHVMFKSALLQWSAILALGIYTGLGSTYIAFGWLAFPAIAYGVGASGKRLSLWMLFLGLVIPITLASSLLILPAAAAGQLVRELGFPNKNPGGASLWSINFLPAGVVAVLVLIFTSYLLPYIHRGLVRWILLLTALSTLVSFSVVKFELVPAFTSYRGKGTFVIHVVEEAESKSYVSVSFPTPGKFDNDVRELVEAGFECGDTSGQPDLVYFQVEKGCIKHVELPEKLSSAEPGFNVQHEEFLASGSFKVTTHTFDTGEALRWFMSIDTDKVRDFSLEILPTDGNGTVVVVPKKGEQILDAVDGWHFLQYASGRNGPIRFRMEVEWREDRTEDDMRPVFKLRLDSASVTKQVRETLELLPDWCVILGKSTNPFNLAYVRTLRYSEVFKERLVA